MNTFLSRLNTIFAFTLSVMAVLTFCCFLTTAFNDSKRPVEIGTAKVTVKNVPDYSADRERSDLGFVVFDLSADLTPLFNWNVKQLFLYLTAEYKTEDHPLNQVVLWDKIIVRGENAILNLKNANTKYYFWDYGNGLKGNNNVTITLSWNVIPNAGTLPKVAGDGRHRIQFPNEYSSGRF
ncbi:LOW QUALITY PROTEIN: signal peptidase complex subunit 3-like [Pomacea canaliculata]|uniref:LOW QUALITY PROTEIN: signal peptidase complex subunit 3-like n=1 Tax=Pomacea canaliculata TaxID=400727 RepID=UPI000D7353BE|nr:LOW QUALITY PROTEIN: signal peptidase complex subunit 3-like [Pomacea canaliculata]